MAVVETEHDSHHAHGEHDHHGHAPFIAHHFDNAEQQFDSGKLGIWVFLVTEVLFFSGLFVAYTLWRSHHPEIFEQAHVFLNKWLGGVNTVVLLFSSLTMAWAVRSAQLGNNRNVAVMVLFTMVCASFFLGVKAVEYSHKWDMGILPASKWAYTGGHAAPTGALAKALGVSDWLVTLSIVPALLLVGFAGISAFLRLTNRTLWSNFFAGMVVMVFGYFLGAVGGHYFIKISEGGGAEHARLAPTVMQETAGSELAFQSDRSLPVLTPVVALNDEPATKDDPAAAQHAGDHASGHDAGHDHADHEHAAGGHGHGDAGGHHLPKAEELSRDVGIFFSIYYCMTGLHAIHILGGIAFLSWIFYRSLAGHWRPDYFGPVDYVGLYWHLVDLIWIYLFPMLYLID